jgi:hypothetical protein
MSRRRAIPILASIGLVFAIQGAPSPQTVAAATVSTECVAIYADDDSICAIVAELADLHATIDELVPDAGIANSLDAKVDAVKSSVLSGRYGPALNQLDAFENEVIGIARENRSYTAISNIMKTKHDTIKNSIGNVR